MSDTAKLTLPLVQAAQAQKHVTVNESLVRLDGMVQLTLVSVDNSAPPGLPSDGDCYGIPTGATNEWSGQDGNIALFSNGGWIFIAPNTGWRAWIQDQSASAMFSGIEWVPGAVTMSDNGAALVQKTLEVDHILSAGPTSSAIGALPASAVVYGITGRVTSAMSGPLTGWRLGVPGTDNSYGSGLGVSAGSWVRGLTSSPQTYYTATDLILTAEGADFVDGQVRLAIHYAELLLPRI